MIRFVFFDIDDTLLDFSWAERHAIRRTYDELGLPMTDTMYARYHQINLEHWQAYERNEFTREAMLLDRHRQMFAEYGFSSDPARCEAIYRRNLGIGHQFMPHVLTVLDYLKPKYRLFITSNGTADTQDSRLESAQIGTYFENIFISERLGALKPDPEYFHRCFAQIPGFQREDAVIIGDSLSSDIRGGIQAGIHTIWFNHDHKPSRPDLRPDHEIHSLLELLDLL